MAQPYSIISFFPWLPAEGEFLDTIQFEGQVAGKHYLINKCLLN